MATLPASLLAAARETPSRKFVEVWNEREGVVQRVSFADLSAAMLSAACFLRSSCGVAEGTRVALLAHNSVAYIALSLGTMCAGGVALHLNTRQPVEATRMLLEGLRPRVLCASGARSCDASRG